MDKCALELFHPPLGHEIAKPITLSIYRLDAQKPLKAAQLSYAVRPPRLSSTPMARISLSASATTHWTYALPCARDDIFTFEVVCETHTSAEEAMIEDAEECAPLEWWQGPDIRNADNSSGTCSIINELS